MSEKEPGKSKTEDAQKKLRDLESTMADLTQKALAMQRADEEDLANKLKSREEWLAQIPKIHELHKQAEAMLRKLLLLKDNPKLKDDPELSKRIGEAEELVESLAEQQENINQQIATIEESQPQVLESLYNDALVQNKKIDESKEQKRLTEEMLVEASQFVDKIKDLTARMNASYVEKDRLDAEVNSAQKKLIELIKHILSGLDLNNSKNLLPKSAINEVLDSVKYPGEHNPFVKLAECRKSLGWFGVKEAKEVLDRALETKGEYEAYINLWKKTVSWREGTKSFDLEKQDLKNKFKAMYKKYEKLPYNNDLSSAVNREIIKLTPLDNQRSVFKNANLWEEIRYGR